MDIAIDSGFIEELANKDSSIDDIVASSAFSSTSSIYSVKESAFLNILLPKIPTAPPPVPTPPMEIITPVNYIQKEEFYALKSHYPFIYKLVFDGN